ncbi:MAG: DMT family transporter [Gammaproteobacteria bacterium]|nr:DMT family transporter [Gammaproteobacteria bacterium]
MKISFNEGLVSVHAAVIVFGMTTLFAKLIELSALEIIPLRSIFAGLALFIYILLKRQQLLLDNIRDYAWVGLLGLLLAIHWVAFFHSMQVSTIAVGVIAMYTYPVITVFLEPFFSGGQPRWPDIISGMVVMVGIFLMVPNFDWSDETAQGVAWGVFSALLFALRNILQRNTMSNYGAHQSMFYQVLVVLVVLLPWVTDSVPEVSSYQWGQLLLLGVLFTALPHTLLVNSLRFLKAKTVGLIACLQVVYSAIFAALILNEIPGVYTLLGGCLVIAAAVYESYFAGADDGPAKPAA